MVKQYAGTSFGRSDSCGSYRTKRKELFRFLQFNYAGQTLYTYLAMFDGLASEFTIITTELVKKEGFFKSFEHFMDVWERETFPHICTDAIAWRHFGRQYQR